MKKLFLALGLAAVACASVPSVQAQTVTIRAEHDENSVSNTHKVLIDLAEDLAKSSGGKVKMEVHSGASLSGGKIPTMIRNVQAGSVDISWIASGIYYANEPRMGVLSLPFIFTGIDDLERVRKSGVMDEVYADQVKRNLQIVDAWSRPLRQVINVKREIRTPADLEGLRLRVPELRLWVDAFKAVGAVPVPMPFSEITTAMQLGTIDGAERPTDFLVAEKWWERAKFVTLLNYTGDAVLVSFNTDFWKKLDPATQKLLTEKIREYGDKKYLIDKAAADDAVAYVKSQGMQVTTLTPAEIQAFRSAMKSVWADHGKQIGAPLMEAVQKAAAAK